MNTTATSSHIFASDDRPVFRIIIYSLSLGFSVLIATLEMLRPAAFGFAFQFSGRTLFAFALAAGTALPCFKVLFLSASKARRVAALALVIVIGVVAFLYPLRYVPQEKFGAIFIGLTIAAGALSVIGSLLLAINRFLNADQCRTELEAQAE